MGEDADRTRTQDDRPDTSQERTGDDAAPERQPPVDRAFARLGGSLGGRPLSVYGVLLAGAAVLLILLAIVWITAGDDDGSDGPGCLNIGVGETRQMIDDGEVEQLDVDWAENRPAAGAVILIVRTVEGPCWSLQPQGVEGRETIEAIVGRAYLRNQIAEDRQIEINIGPRDGIPIHLLVTRTPIPTATPVPPPTEPVPTDAPASPTAVPPTETPEPTATRPIVPAGSPEASPEASPAVSPEATDDPAPAPTETSTPAG